MGNLNSFPLVLAIKSGPSVRNELSMFELAIRNTAAKSTAAMEKAGRSADNAFALNRARGELKVFEREFQGVFEKFSRQSRTNGFSLSSMGDAALLTNIRQATNAQATAEETLAAARRRAHAERMSQIDSELQAGLSSARQRQEAEAAAFRSATAEAERRVQLERQRVVESAKMIAGPANLQGVTLNPASAQQAAAAARAYATAQREIAQAATVTASAVGTATAADKAFAVTARESAAAAELEARRLEQVAVTHGKVAGALVAAGGNLAKTSSAAATSAGAQRAAYLNLSQQIADTAIQAQMGTSAFTILLQQGTQASTALVGAGGKLAALGRFLTNPWVTAALTAGAVLGTFVTKLNDASDASSLAKTGANALTDAQSALGGMFDLTSGKLEKQNQLLLLNARLTAINLRADALAKQASSAKVFGQQGLSTTTRLRAGASAWLPDVIGNLVGGDYFKARENQQALRRLEQERTRAESIKNADARAKAMDAVLTKSEKLDFSGLKITGEEYRQALIDRTVSGLNTEVAKMIDGSLDSGKLAPGLRTPSPKKSGGGSADAKANRIAGLEENGRDIFDRIQSIAAPFGDQPKLVQQTAKAMADLADITDDLTRKNDAYVKATGKSLPLYDKALSKAKEAAAIIGNAPVMAVQQQTDALADQIRIQELLAQGRPAEAEALQAKLAILRQIGVELGKEPEAVAQALEQYEAQRKRLAQLTVDAQATSATKQIEQANQILAAQIAGNEDLADLMSRRFQLEQGEAKVSEEQLANLDQRLQRNRELTKEYERRNQLVAVQVQQARDLQSAFENFLTEPFKKGGLKEFADSITQSRKQAIAREISVKLFGDMGSTVEDKLRNAGTVVTAAGETLKQSASSISDSAGKALEAHQGAAKALTDSAVAIDQAAKNFRASNDNAPSLGQLSTTPTAFTNGNTQLEGLYDFAKDLRPIADVWSNVQPAQELAEIVVTAQRYIPAAAQRVASGGGRGGIGFGADGLTTLLSFASGAVGGKTGAAINGILNMAAFNQMGQLAASGITKLGGGSFAAAGIGQTVGNGIAGIGQGMAMDGIVKALGLKGSKTGAAIGGAIGNAILPGIGGFIGGTLGSLVGGAFKKTAFSTSSFNTKDGQLIKGNNDGNKASASTAAKGSRDAVVEGLNKVLEQFGGTISGDPGVTVGVYDGKYRVSTTGYRGKLDFKGSSANGLVNFGKDGAEAAVKFAIQTIIEKGVISGIRASTKKLLSSGKDLEDAIAKATDFENVFLELKSYTDPVGAAIDALDKRFTYLRKIFGEAGASAAEYADLEKFYGIKRAEAVEQATKNMTSSLEGFLDSLKFSGETGLSLRTRQTNAKAKFDPIAADILAGRTIDQDKFTEVAGSYLDIAREIYGSTQGYFDLLSQVTNLTGKAIENVGATNVTPITAAASTAASVATTSPAVRQAVETQTVTLNGTLISIRQTLERLSGLPAAAAAAPEAQAARVTVSASRLSALRNA